VILDGRKNDTLDNIFLLSLNIRHHKLINVPTLDWMFNSARWLINLQIKTHYSQQQWVLTNHMTLLPDIRLNIMYEILHREGIITRSPCSKWQNIVTMPFFGTKIPTTKHKIMLHDMLLKGGSRTSMNCIRTSWQLGTKWINVLLIRQSVSGTRVFVCVLKRNADILNTNWASSSECCCWCNSLPDSVVESNSFKNNLDKFWQNEDVKFNWKANLTGAGSRSLSLT